MNALKKFPAAVKLIFFNSNNDFTYIAISYILSLGIFSNPGR